MQQEVSDTDCPRCSVNSCMYVWVCVPGARTETAIWSPTACTCCMCGCARRLDKRLFNKKRKFSQNMKYQPQRFQHTAVEAAQHIIVFMLRAGKPLCCRSAANRRRPTHQSLESKAACRSNVSCMACGSSCEYSKVSCYGLRDHHKAYTHASRQRAILVSFFHQSCAARAHTAIPLGVCRQLRAELFKGARTPRAPRPAQVMHTLSMANWFTDRMPRPSRLSKLGGTCKIIRNVCCLIDILMPQHVSFGSAGRQIASRQMHKHHARWTPSRTRHTTPPSRKRCCTALHDVHTALSDRASPEVCALTVLVLTRTDDTVMAAMFLNFGRK